MYQSSLLIFNCIGTRVVFWTIQYCQSQLLIIPSINSFWVSESLCKDYWYTNFVRIQQRIRRNNCSGCIVYTFTHHKHSKQSLLFLQKLTYTLQTTAFLRGEEI